jgi:hypothetical protein
MLKGMEAIVGEECCFGVVKNTKNAAIIVWFIDHDVDCSSIEIIRLKDMEKSSK